MTDQKHPENMEFFKYCGSMITVYARHTRAIKSRIGMAQAAFSRRMFFSPAN
jgi:hypothetical protein